MAGEPVYHLELKQGFAVVRRFNLSRARLESGFLRTWLAGKAIELDDHRFHSETARIRIIRGKELPTAQMGMGRGWATVEKDGEYVTDEALAAAAQPASAMAAGDPAIEAFKDQVHAAAAGEAPLTLARVAAMAGEGNPRLRVSEQLALAERGVWELLHQGRVALYTPDDLGAATQERWQPVLLAWGSWGGELAPRITLEAL